MTTIRWLESPAASALYMAAVAAAGRPAANREVTEALGAPASALGEKLTSAGVEPASIWPYLIPLAASVAEPHDLVRRTLVAAGRPTPDQATIDELAAAISDMIAAVSTVMPTAAQELSLRAGPLREQWEARGPGLLAAVGRSTERALLVDTADVLVVYPASGGGGAAYSPQATIAIEGVLANPLPQLPEVVRLAWLLASLGLERQPSDEPIAAERWAWLGQLALVPAVLAAAEHVELARCDKETLQLSLVAWGLTDSGADDQAAQLASILDTWWKIYRLAPAPWPAALLAIDRISKGPR